jgi:cyanophycinase-like exopeptidase
MAQHGPFILIGSGETHRHGRQVQEEVLKELPVPAIVAILATPAGFQPNAAFVAGKLREFVEHSLQNYRPRVTVIDALRKGGPGDPDDPEVYGPLAEATYILAGPGSPTYLARHLADTRTLALVRERWAAGAGLTFASAAAVAMGRHALPVYEIYKAGDDLSWRPGLDLLGEFGLDLAIIPHWNNREGGANLDTGRCYMGQERFERLIELLPPTATVLGIDEHTSCVVDIAADRLRVRGQGEVTIIQGGETRTLASGTDAPLAALRGAATVRLPGAG